MHTDKSGTLEYDEAQKASCYQNVFCRPIFAQLASASNLLPYLQGNDSAEDHEPAHGALETKWGLRILLVQMCKA